MQLNEWTEFLVHVQVPDRKSRHCKMRDCDMVFVATDYEDKAAAGGEAEAKALLRFEFVEAIIRIALLKFGKDSPRAPHGAALV